MKQRAQLDYAKYTTRYSASIEEKWTPIAIAVPHGLGRMLRKDCQPRREEVHVSGWSSERVAGNSFPARNAALS